MHRKSLAILKENSLSCTLAAIACFIGVLPILFIPEIPKVSNSIIILLILFFLLFLLK